MSERKKSILVKAKPAHEEADIVVTPAKLAKQKPLDPRSDRALLNQGLRRVRFVLPKELWARFVDVRGHPKAGDLNRWFIEQVQREVGDLGGEA